MAQYILLVKKVLGQFEGELSYDDKTTKQSVVYEH